MDWGTAMASPFRHPMMATPVSWHPWASERPHKSEELYGSVPNQQQCRQPNDTNEEIDDTNDINDDTNDTNDYIIHPATTGMSVCLGKESELLNLPNFARKTATNAVKRYQDTESNNDRVRSGRGRRLQTPPSTEESSRSKSKGILSVRQGNSPTPSKISRRTRPANT
ncbi:unnamed protein product [Darwinula stevensoni]|uniref:Uncharacterized protein n=1 Tax=Darwinula stevensoni TaxID=69355 RepID=A0A7R8XHB6_9CRUS|nr:unnamed protein product [Darwinula stevensoni]CAG0892388.1 unnamed protein product [Darwinula stevensoni]